jgi:hypothetical protein
VTKTRKKKTGSSIAPGVVEGRFATLNAIIRRWFYQPDLQGIRVTMGTMKAHYLGIGDPAWLFVVAPPGTGKTTLTIMGMAQLPEVVSLGAFTPNTFLSGFYGQREPGILEKLGETTEKGRVYTTVGNGILLAKDFTTVLSMRHEARAEILAQLREMHDSEFRRSFGTGETKVWRGRITLITAVTPVIDRQYSAFGTLGDRFLQIRWHRPTSLRAGQRAIRQQGSEEIIRKQLQWAIKNVFDGSLTLVPTMNAHAERRIASLAELVAIARTHVFRSNFGKREIDCVPESEANTRISKGLAAIAKGLAALNRRRTVAEQDLQDVFRVGLDTIPDNRRRLLFSIAQGKNCRTVGLPQTVTLREIEELESLGLSVTKGGLPRLTRQTAQLLQAVNIIVD